MQNNNDDDRKVFSVTELTCLIRVQLETKFPAVWVQGEVSNCTYQSSGHIYFTLKDQNSVLSCVMFRGMASGLKFKIETGRHYKLSGALRVYEPRGAYQLVVNAVEDSSREGELYREFLRRKEHYAALGYFAQERKKPLPSFPSTIGIVSSRTGAVIRDIMQVINRRYPLGLDIRLYPAKMQGVEAAAEIAAGIRFFNEHPVDLIIIARGGGSIEDLWAFNEDLVVEAIYNSQIPLISAVGHETDYTLSDFAACLRAGTPSMAGELCVPNLADLRLRLEALSPDKLRRGLEACFQYGAQQNDYNFVSLKSAYRNFLLVYKYQLENACPKRQQQNLLHLLQAGKHVLTEHFLHLERGLSGLLKAQEKRLTAVRELLYQSDLSGLLQRGFSVLTDKKGNIIKSVLQVKKSDSLQVLLHDGSLKTQVTEVIAD